MATKRWQCCLIATILACAQPAAAQSAGAEEIVVTAARIRADQPPPPLPAVVIRKRADFLLQSIELINDTRDAKARENELYQTLRGLAAAAAKTPGLSLAWQNGFLMPITERDYQIPLQPDDERDDASRVVLYIKYALTPQSDVPRAVKTLAAFVDDAKMVGRSSIEPLGDVALSIVNPERYRPEVVQAIAASVKDLQQAFGAACKVRVGLGDFSNRLQWQRSDVSELTLYLPYRMSVEGC